MLGVVKGVDICLGCCVMGCVGSGYVLGVELCVDICCMGLYSGWIYVVGVG